MLLIITLLLLLLLSQSETSYLMSLCVKSYVHHLYLHKIFLFLGSQVKLCIESPNKTFNINAKYNINLSERLTATVESIISGELWRGLIT